MPFKSPYKIGIALGGGGVRGLANIGVLKAMEESGIKPDVISGTSMGAIVGALYADTLNASGTESTIREVLSSEEFIRQVQKLGSLSGGTDMDRGFFEKMFDTAKKGYAFYRFMTKDSVVSQAAYEQIEKLVPEKNFSDLKLRFACIALDLVSGNTVIFRSGSLRTAIRASSAVPGVLPPVGLDGRMYVDGGWAESVPISAVKQLGAHFIIASDVTRDITAIEAKTDLKNSMDIMLRANDIVRSSMNMLRTKEADFVIHPEVGDAPWSAFENLDAYITSGYKAAKMAMPSLKKAILKFKVTRLLRLFR
ncbi:MAG: patatin-like phospholipase family protein [Deltaproteobacteria bacterium]